MAGLGRGTAAARRRRSPGPGPVTGDTYEPILLEPIKALDAWPDMLRWMTEGDVRAEVR